MISKEELELLTRGICNLAEENTLENIKMLLEHIKEQKLYETLKIENILDIAIGWLQLSINECERIIKK